MAELLPEVLLHTCSFLDKKSLSNLRLTCRYFNKIATCYAFKNFVFYVKDLKMLDQISQNPEIAKNIQSLDYNADLLPLPALELSEFARHLANRRTSNPVQSDGAIPPMPDLEERFKEYRAAVSEQRRIVDSQEDFKVLKKVIPRLAALKEINIWARKYTFFFPNGSEVPPYFKKHLNDLGTYSKCFLPEGARQTEAVLRALSGIQARPMRLCISPLHWSFFTFKHKSVIDNNPSFDFLTELVIKITRNQHGNFPWFEMARTSSEAGMCRDAMRNGILKRFLVGLKRLERVCIAFDDALEENQDAAVSFTDIVEPGHRWERLKSFTIGRVDCEHHEIMAFLELHASTLEKVNLDNLHLRSTSRMAFIPDLQSSLKLKGVDVTISGGVVD